MSRALRALSSTYVERRHKLSDGAALSGAGKRAAFALFYAPLHYLLVRHIFHELSGGNRNAPHVVDLGCGTGAAGAAIATQHVVGVDKNQWAVAEAARTYRAFGLDGVARQGDASAYRFPNRATTVVAAFTMNELPDASREALLARLLDRVRSKGDRLLIVEPLAKGAARWWESWREAFERSGGRSDEWRVAVELPEIVAKLDRAAGLQHREITGRSFWIAPTSTASSTASN